MTSYRTSQDLHLIPEPPSHPRTSTPPQEPCPVGSLGGMQDPSCEQAGQRDGVREGADRKQQSFPDTIIIFFSFTF